ncbi:MAG: amylo-alpha-1,6-glucosidase [Gemmatimonadaceae bacterium]|nr:amylo-alpha-1,6-glucosidase [Acetobacteraceae bacterium]
MTQQTALPNEFYIPATVSLQSRRTRTLKSGDTFGVFDSSGDAAGSPISTDGIYHRDTRHLSRLELLIDGQRPVLLSSTLRDDNAELTCDLANPDLYEDGRIVLEHDLLHLRRSRFLWQATCYERLSIRSFAQVARRVRIDLRFEADFTDLFQSRGMTRANHGEIMSPDYGADVVTLSYVGLDKRPRSTRLRFDPPPAVLNGRHAVFEFDIEPGATQLFFVEIACDPAVADDSPRRAFNRALLESRRRLRQEIGRAAVVITSNEVFNEAMRRSIGDLYMLVTDKETGAYPYAGVPWFSAAFGRDALITALQTLWLDPSITRGVLAYLAKNQATTTDAAADAEPGKILHEVRYGEMAELREVPFRRYYGSVDSTPLFVMLAGAYVERTGDLETAARLWPNIRSALNWIEVHGDRDGDGFVEYYRQTAEGLANQGWKDSHDSVFHADGSIAVGPIALAEVQGYAFAARRSAAEIARRLGHGAEASALEARASVLQEAFEKAFWCEDIGTYAIALDGQKRPCRVRASNAGHLLLTGIATPEHGRRVAAQLMSRTFFSGWGIRTLALGEPRYNPMSYHNGSVWPHDNALIALGMARYGCRAETSRLFGAMFDACQTIELRRLPELFCGFPRRRAQAPTGYPVACSPQAWAATALLAMLQACLGLSFDPERRVVRFTHPVLPASLDEVTLLNLELGGATISVQLRRVGDEVAMNVLGRTGTIQAMLVS